MKKSLFIKLHVYCGLFTCFYLISLGTSSLVLNHNLDVDQKDVTKTWESQVEIDTLLTEGDLATSIRDQIGMMGWVPPWRYKKTTGQFDFQITHLGKNSDVSADLISGKVKIIEQRKGFLSVLHGMHFFNGKIPNASFILRSFVVYQYLGLLVLLISLLLGLWLWFKYSYHRWETFAFGILFICSVFIMLLL